MNNAEALAIIKGEKVVDPDDFSAGFRPAKNILAATDNVLWSAVSKTLGESSKNEDKFIVMPVKVSHSYSTKRREELSELNSWIPLYLRPINDKLKVSFDILLTNNKDIIHVLEDFLASEGFPPRVQYDGFLASGTEIGFSQFIRRYLPNVEEKVIKFINKVVEEIA